MDIIVEGIGTKYYTPDQAEFSIDFYTLAESYESALEKGTEDVEVFLKEVVEQLGYEKDILKTRSFRVYEETRYDYDKKENQSLGFAYTQNATIKFDYSMQKVAQFMEKVSTLKNAPKYRLNFYVKDIKQCKNEAIKEAYIDAKQKAEAIAQASGKELKECIKIDFRPFEERVSSRSSINSLDMLFEEEGETASIQKRSKSLKVQDTIQTIFTPEDVIVSETLYCMWLAN